MKTRWYKDCVFYQIYPRSFCDGNGDGIGDIRGIISKQDYLKDLGITAVWLSPVYVSPNRDNGYDVSDYKNIQPEFGTMEDFKEMLDGFHKRGIKLIMDLVANHTSDLNEWFVQSRSAKDDPYRDYYVWRKGRGKDGKLPPNNWTSRFTGPAWTYDEKTKEWYLHLFTPEQPDLNWDNPKVRQEIADICNFWFDIGVDGFRCDVITYISKNKGLPDGKFHLLQRGDEHFIIGENFHEYLKEININSWSRYDSFVVGEAIGTTAEDCVHLIKESNNELDSAITFELMNVDTKLDFFKTKLDLVKFKKVINKWQNLGNDCFPTLYYENHDQPRSISRYDLSKGKYLQELAKMLCVSLMFRRGTPYVYQGQEIGMTNHDFSVEEYKDVVSINVLKMLKQYHLLNKYTLRKLREKARDNARTPMQWDESEGAGFTKAKPWMIINPNHKTVNVKSQLNDDNSVLSFYKKIISVRTNNKVISEGSFRLLKEKDKDLFVYERTLNEKGYLVICNFKPFDVKFKSNKDTDLANYKLLISNYDSAPEVIQNTVLKPYQCIVYQK